MTRSSSFTSAITKRSTVELPQPDLVIYLQAKPEVLLGRIAKKKAHEERQISTEYVQEVARAYEHFFFPL